MCFWELQNCSWGMIWGAMVIHSLSKFYQEHDNEPESAAILGTYQVTRAFLAPCFLAPPPACYCNAQNPVVKMPTRQAWIRELQSEQVAGCSQWSQSCCVYTSKNKSKRSSQLVQTNTNVCRHHLWDDIHVVAYFTCANQCMLCRWGSFHGCQYCASTSC